MSLTTLATQTRCTDSSVSGRCGQWGWVSGRGGVSGRCGRWGSVVSVWCWCVVRLCVCKVCPSPSPGYMLEVDSKKRPDIFQVAHVVFAMKGERNPVPNIFVSGCLCVCMYVCVYVRVYLRIYISHYSPSIPSLPLPLPPALSPPLSASPSPNRNRVKANNSPYQEEVSSLSSPLT